jgi:hypothetical protein
MGLRLAVCLAVFGAVPAMAAPRVAVHPLVATGGDARSVDQSRADFIGEAARQPIQMVSRTQVTEALASRGGACGPKVEACLEGLGRDTGATYALLATLLLDGPAFVLGAKVVAADGTVVKSIEALTIEKDLFSPRSPQVQAAFKKLFAQLELGKLPDTLPVKKAEPPVVSVAPAPTSDPVPPSTATLDIPVVEEDHSDGTPGSRVAGFVIGGAALAAAGVGTGFALSAYSNGESLKPTLINGSLKDDSYLPTAQSIDRNTSIATGLFVGAGVAAAVSVALIVLSIESSPPVAITPIEGGAMVGLAGSF